MKNYKIVGTKVKNEYAGFNFAVTKVIEDVNGNIERTTHFFDEEQEAHDKFLTLIMRESKLITKQQIRFGYNTDGIIEISALTDDEILDAYGTYDTASGKIITQILILKNPEAKAC